MSETCLGKFSIESLAAALAPGASLRAETSTDIDLARFVFSSDRMEICQHSQNTTIISGIPRLPSSPKWKSENKSEFFCPIKPFVSIIKMLEKRQMEELSIYKLNGYLQICCERLTVQLQSYENPKTIPDFDKNDLSSHFAAEIDADAFRHGLSRIVKNQASGNNPTICGVGISINKFEGNPVLRLVATTGIALSEARIDLRKTGPAENLLHNIVMIPKSVVKSIVLAVTNSQQENPVAICIRNNNIIIITAENILNCPLSSSSYPDINKIIPHNISNPVSADSTSLKTMLSRITVGEKQTGIPVRITYGQNLLSMSADSDFGNMTETLTDLPKTETDNLEGTLCFDSRVLKTAISQTGETVEIHVRGPKKPVLITFPPETTFRGAYVRTRHVLMPMNL